MTHNALSESNIEAVVMRRVFTAHALRPLVGGAALALVIAVFALWGIGREVWVAKVLENAPADYTLAPRFFIEAFINTRIAVQLFTLAALGGILWFFRDLFRTLSFTLASSRA
jgi:hypothetical protein